MSLQKSLPDLICQPHWETGIPQGKRSKGTEQTLNKRGFKEQEGQLDLLQYGPTLLQSSSENVDAARTITRPTTPWNSFYSLQRQLTLGSTDTGELGLRVCARASPAPPVRVLPTALPPTGGGDSGGAGAGPGAGAGQGPGQEPRPGRGRPALTGGGPGAEGGLSAHVRASVPKQSWPAPLGHRRPPLTLPARAPVAPQVCPSRGV